MSKTTPVASPSPPLRSTSRHQSPQIKHNSSDSSIHRKSSELVCDSPTDFQSLAAKSTDVYQDDEPFSANLSTPTIDIDADNICDKITVNSAHQQFCLRWNNYGRNLTNVFDQLLQNESFVDVTLACDGQSIKAHKMVLSACSPYFQSLFFDNPCQHPIIIMRDVKWTELKAIVEFMYKGEIKVSQAEIGPLLRVAEMLKIRGLTEVNGEHEFNTESKKSRSDSPQQPSEHSRAETPSIKKSRPHKRLSVEWDENRSNTSPPLEKHRRTKRTSPTFDRHSTDSPRIDTATASEFAINTNAAQSTSVTQKGRNNISPSSAGRHATNISTTLFPITSQSSVDPLVSLTTTEDMEIKPGIAEMIREEERAKVMETAQTWPGVPSTNTLAESYQYQLQSMWQKCWSTNQNLVHNLRFRERGPLKSWRPETMAEAIFSVLKDGLSLSQAARKYDIPYPTFVLYANRVHNMLGPSMDSGLDLRPKGRGRPQRILLGIWPDDHIKGVIKAVVFRDAKDLKDDPSIHLAAAAAAAAAYGRHSPVYPFHDGAIPGFHSSPNGLMSSSSGANDSIPSEAAVAMAAVMGLRQQHLNAAVANQHHSESDLSNFNLRSDSGGVGCLKQPKLGSPATSSQPNSHEMNFPMPRLASPAIPNIHSISGLSSLHLMQQHNLSGNGDLISNRTRNRSNDSRTPPHTETSKHCHTESMNRNEKTSRNSNIIEQQLKHLNKTSSSSNNNNNNNNNTKETSEAVSSPIGEKQINFPIVDFDSVGVDIAINGLPFKSSLHGFLTSTSPNEEPPLFTDELNDFDESEASPNSNTRDKIKMEPLTECRADTKII